MVNLAGLDRELNDYRASSREPGGLYERFICNQTVIIISAYVSIFSQQLQVTIDRWELTALVEQHQ